MRFSKDTQCGKTSFNEDYTVTTPIDPSMQASIEIDEGEITKNPAINLPKKSVTCNYTVHQVKKLCQASEMLLKNEDDKVTVHHIKSGRNGRFTVDFKFASKQHYFKFR